MEEFNWNSDPINPIYISKSNIDGKGVFAGKDINANENVGTAIKVSSFKGNTEYPRDFFITSIADRLNHKDNPNAKLIKSGYIYKLVSNRKINKDSEITVDYKKNPIFVERNTKGFVQNNY